MTSYVFLSYASPERPRALEIADLLEAQGIGVWIDRKSIAGGTSWSAEIVRGIRDCAAFLVLCSPKAMASPNVQQEVQLAFETRRPILPLLLAPTELPDAVRYGLAGRQWIELGDRPDSAWLPQLTQAIRTLGAPSRAATARDASPANAPSSTPLSSPSAGRHNLPTQVTSFVGRVREREDVKQHLQSSRLLTLTGTGGCGKTRLALEVAGELVSSYPDGIWLVELAPLADPSTVPATVAGAIGVPEAPGQTIQSALVSFLRPRRLLIVLDNCEHLIDSCAQLANAILRGCPDVQILATSRESLAIPGEFSWRVPSLAVDALETDAPTGTMANNEAVRLFAERARAVYPSFTLGDQNLPLVAQICRRLDGIPLAIELAAGRVKALSIEQISARLDQRFRLLTGGSRAALPRQQTLAALVGWSYDLLTPAEQTLFNRLSVFAGGWTLDAAEAVCADDAEGSRFSVLGSSPPTPQDSRPTPQFYRPGTEHLVPRTQNLDSTAQRLTPIRRDDVLELLTELVDKSLVVAIDGPTGVERYRLLETLRQFGRERLSATDDAEAMHRRHAAYFRELVLEIGRQSLVATTSNPRDRMKQESDNIQASLRWFVETGSGEDGLAMLRNLPNTIFLLWDPAETAGWFERLIGLLPASTPSPVRLDGLVEAAWILKSRGDWERARRFRDEALAFAQSSGDRMLLARASPRLALWFRQPDFNLADLTSALGVFRQVGDSTWTMSTLFSVGRNCCWASQLGRARTYVVEGLALARELASPQHIAFGLEILGEIATPTDIAEARQHLLESQRLFQQIGDPWGVVATTYYLARANLLESEYKEAAQRYRSVLNRTRPWRLVDRTVQAIDGLAAIAVAQGQPERALRLASVSARERQVRVENFSPLEVAEVTAWLDRARATVGEPAAARAWSEGLALSLDEAIAYALSDNTDQ
jgi:non-specific serine/threonine protein kinase